MTDTNQKSLTSEQVKENYIQRKRQAVVQQQLLNDYNYLRSKESSGLYNTCHNVMSSQGKQGLIDLIKISQAMLSHIDRGSTL